MVSQTELQEKNWVLLKSHINSVLQAATSGNLAETLKQLLDVNILLGQDLVVDAILKIQKDEDKSLPFAALSAMLNSEIATFGEKLCQLASALLISAYNNFDNQVCYHMLSLLGQLFNYEVLHEIVILQILSLLLDDVQNGSVEMIAHLLLICDKQLAEVSKTPHRMIYEKLRELLQSGRLPSESSATVQLLFDKRKISNQQVIPLPLQEYKVNMHSFMIDEINTDSEQKIGSFHALDTSEFVQSQEDFDKLKELYLGQLGTEEKVVVVKDKTGAEEVAYKKKIYLILKSSLTGDEAAHKVLCLRTPDDEKYKIVDIIVKSSIQESTYSKFYGSLCDKLLNSHKSWKPAFMKIFNQTYAECDAMEPAQLRIVGNLWGHLVGTDFIGLEILQNVYMDETNSTPAKRIMIKFFFQELVKEIGVDELRARLQEDYIQPFIRNTFPQEDAENMRYSINYFTAIGLGILTENMRNKLNIIQDTEATEQKQPPPMRNRERRRRSITPPRRRNRSRSPRRFNKRT